MSQYKDILIGLFNFLEFDLSKEILPKHVETKRAFFLQQLTALGIYNEKKVSSDQFKRFSLPVINKLDNNSSAYNTLRGDNSLKNTDSDNNYNLDTLRYESNKQENVYHQDSIYETPISAADIDYEQGENFEGSYKSDNSNETISKDSAMLLPRKSFLQTRRLSVNMTDNAWTLLGPLKHRVKNNKWIKLNACLLLSNARLIAFKTYPIKSNIFSPSNNWNNSNSLCIYLCGAHGLYAARDSGMNHVIKISAPGTDYETHVLAAANEQQALIWTDQINQYATGNIPSHSFSFLNNDLVATFSSIPSSLHPVTYIVANETFEEAKLDTAISHANMSSPNCSKFPNKKIDDGRYTLTPRLSTPLHHHQYETNLMNSTRSSLDESQESIASLKSSRFSLTESKRTFSKKNSLLSSVRRKMEQQFPSKRRLSMQQLESVQSEQNIMSPTNHVKKAMTITGANQSSNQNALSSNYNYSVEFLHCPSTSPSNVQSGLNWSQLTVGAQIFLRKMSSPTNASSLGPNSFLDAKFGSPTTFKKDVSLTPSVKLRASFRRASLSAFKFNHSVSDLSNRQSKAFDNDLTISDPMNNFKDPDELISGEAQICIPDLTPWTTRWCRLKNNCLNIYSTPTRPLPSQMNKPIFSLTMRPGLVHLELANDKRYRAAIKLSAPTMSNKSLFFNVNDKIVIGGWIRGFIQTLGMIPSRRKNSPLHLINLQNLSSMDSHQDLNTDLDSPVYSEVTSVAETFKDSLTLNPKETNHLIDYSDTRNNISTPTSFIRPFSMIQTNYEDEHDNEERARSGSQSPVYDEVFHILQNSTPCEMPYSYYQRNDPERCHPLKSHHDENHNLSTLINHAKQLSNPESKQPFDSTHTPPHNDQITQRDKNIRKATSFESFSPTNSNGPMKAKGAGDNLNKSFTYNNESNDQPQSPSNSLVKLSERADDVYAEELVSQNKREPAVSSSSVITVGRSISCKCPVLNYPKTSTDSSLKRTLENNRCISSTLPTRPNPIAEGLVKHHDIHPGQCRILMHKEAAIGPMKEASLSNNKGQFYSTSNSSFNSSSLSSRTAASSGIPLNNNACSSENNTRPPSSSFCGSNSFNETGGKFNESIYCNEEVFNKDFYQDYNPAPVELTCTDPLRNLVHDVGSSSSSSNLDTLQARQHSGNIAPSDVRDAVCTYNYDKMAGLVYNQNLETLVVDSVNNETLKHGCDQLTCQDFDESLPNNLTKNRRKRRNKKR